MDSALQERHLDPLSPSLAFEMGLVLRCVCVCVCKIYRFWAHLTRASFKVENRIPEEKNCISSFSRLPRPRLRPIFGLKMAKSRFFQNCKITRANRTKFFGIHTHISSRLKIKPLTLTSKVIGGHWRSLEVNLPRHHWG